MVLEYGPGLADRLVAGEIDPGRIYISRATCTIAHELRVEGETAAARSRLTEPRVRELGRMALELEGALGAPQDIEWAIDRDGRLAIVQSRAVTTWRPAAPAGASALWSNANINENFPEPVSPLLYSIAAPGYYHYFRNLGLAFGVSRRRLAAMDAALRGVIGVHGARLYYNLTNIHAVLRMAPFGERLAGAFNLFVGAHDTAHQPPGATAWTDGRGPMGRTLELIRIAGAVTWQFLFLGRRLRLFERDADVYAARTSSKALSARALPALGEDLVAFVDIRCRRWKNASLCDTAAMVSYALLRWLLARQGFGDDTHTRLLRALPGVPSGEPPLHLWALSRRIRSDSGLRAMFLSRPAVEVLHAVRHDRRLAMFARQLDAYLEAWGFRSSGELMLTAPTLEEQPEPVIDLLKQYVQADGRSPDENMARLAAERRAETGFILRTLATRAPLQALLIGALIRSTQKAVVYRERARLKQALLYTRCRRVALRIGEALVRDGRLTDARGVFMLTWQELDELCSGRAMLPRGVGALVAARQSQHAVESAMRPPDTFHLAIGSHFNPSSVRLEADQSACGPHPQADGGGMPLLRGATACGGRVSARAAVLSGVHEANRLARGDVLVTRQTDPGWAPVFGLVSGLVIERGGMLSHGAIIAREFGLPCVVGVKSATALIPHVALLTVDADLGTCRVEGRP
jgi:pyruvate,water dikinase